MRTQALAIALLMLAGAIIVAPNAYAAPEVTSITPATGPVGGGTNIVVTGTGFVAGATVTIGGTSATGVVVNSATEIVATTAAKPAGTYNLVVTLPDTTTYTEANAFTYAATPTITTVSPASGPTAGGTTVTITGTNFRAGIAVTFGGTAGTGLVFNSATELVVTTPAKTAGLYAVVVTNSDTSTYTKANGFQYGDQPTITAVAPATVGTSGGANVQVTGTNFRTTGTTLTVGGTAFTGVTVNSPTELVATAPAKAEGTYNVVVTVDGLSYAKANALTYAPVASPTITTVAPNAGPVAGGTVITLTGTGFKSGLTVTVGGTAATGVTFIDSTTVQATTPAKAAAVYNVVLTNTDGGSKTVLNGFIYQAAPVITAASPPSGTIAGGTALTITGTDFRDGITGTIDGVPFTAFTRGGATTITATTPAHPAGGVSIVLRNTDGQTASTTFTYGLPGESGYTANDYYAATAQTLSGKWSHMQVHNQSQVVIAHGVGVGNQAVVSSTIDGGENWFDYPLPGETGTTGFRTAVLSDSKWAVQYLKSGVGLRRAVTVNGGESYTITTATGQMCGSTNELQHDLAAKQGRYVSAIAMTGFSGGCTTNGLWVAQSYDSGATFSAVTYNCGSPYAGQGCLAGGNRCGNTGAGDMVQTAHVSMPQGFTWYIHWTGERCATAGGGFYICGLVTMDNGVTFAPLQGYTTCVINDSFTPLTSYGASLSVSTDGDTLLFAGTSNTATLGKRLSTGSYVFTQLTGTLLTGTRTDVENAPDGAVWGTYEVTGTTEYFRTVYSATGDSPFGIVTPIAANNGANTYLSPSVVVDCPYFYTSYQDPTTGKLRVLRTTNSDADCGATDSVFIEAPTDGLRGFDMSPGGTDTAIITREDDGFVRTYDPTTLVMRGEADSECNNRPDGVTAAYPAVAFAFCADGDSFDVSGFKVRDFWLDSLDICDYCHTTLNTEGTIDEEDDAFIDTPEGIGQISYSTRYPYTFTNTGQVGAADTTRVVFPLTIAGTGEFGIYAIEFTDSCENIVGCVHPDGFKLLPFAGDGQTITQMCVWRTETHDYDLIGVVHPTAGLRVYRFTVDFNTGAELQDDLAGDITITPYFTPSGSTANALGLACAGDVLAYAVADTAASPGKVVAVYADGAKKGQKVFEVPDVDPVNRGIAMAANVEYVAYTDYSRSETTIHFLAINGTELTKLSIGDRDFYQMALDRPGGMLAVANLPGGEAPTGSLMRFDLTGVDGGCGTNCTDTNPDPFDPECGTGCGGDDPDTPECEDPNGCTTSTNTSGPGDGTANVCSDFCEISWGFALIAAGALLGWLISGLKRSKNSWGDVEWSVTAGSPIIITIFAGLGLMGSWFLHGFFVIVTIVLVVLGGVAFWLSLGRKVTGAQ